MVVKNVGSALRFCIPQQVGKKIGEFWELIKPLIDFKYEVSESFILDIENTCIQFMYPFCAYTLLFVICALQYCACTVCVCVELDS